MSEKKNLEVLAPAAPVQSRASGASGLALLFTGSIALLVPLTAEAADWLREECQTEPWQWTTMNGGDALAVEPDAADEIMAAWEAR